MLYDLNIAWSPSTSSAQLQRTLRFASSLGYDVVALNHTVSPPITSPPTNPIPLLTAPPTSHPQPSGGTTPRSLSPSQSADKKIPTALRRVTITIADPTANHRLSAFASAYDVVAVRPTTERAFAACCTTMSEFSIISLDLTDSHPFHFHPRTSMAAVNRGVRFELCYAQALAAGDAGDARARSNFVSNLMGLVRATRGRGLVLSSEARGPLDLRAPADVVNLLAVWGLGTERGKEALGVNPRAVVVNEGIKRRGFRGVVDIIRSAEGGPAARKDGSGAPEEKTGTSSKGKNPGKKAKEGKGAKAGGEGDQEEQRNQGQKRGNGEVDPSSGEPVSKRQAKKMRMASRNANPPASE